LNIVAVKKKLGAKIYTFRQLLYINRTIGEVFLISKYLKEKGRFHCCYYDEMVIDCNCNSIKDTGQKWYLMCTEQKLVELNADPLVNAVMYEILLVILAFC